MVEIVPIQDHCPPKFYQIKQFCENLDTWLKSSPNHVGIVHCKAGKVGRIRMILIFRLIFILNQNHIG